jgi:hypothetical protein
VQNYKIGTDSIFDRANNLPAAVSDKMVEFMPASAKEALATAAAQKAQVGIEAVAQSTQNPVVSVQSSSVTHSGVAIGQSAVYTETPSEIISSPIPGTETPTQVITAESTPKITVTENTPLVDENSNPISVVENIQNIVPQNSTNLIRFFADQGVAYGTTIQTFGAQSIESLMNTVNPDATTQKVISFLQAYSQAANLAIPKTGTVLQYLLTTPNSGGYVVGPQ